MATYSFSSSFVGSAQVERAEAAPVQAEQEATNPLATLKMDVVDQVMTADLPMQALDILDSTIRPLAVDETPIDEPQLEKAVNDRAKTRLPKRLLGVELTLDQVIVPASDDEAEDVTLRDVLVDAFTGQVIRRIDAINRETTVEVVQRVAVPTPGNDEIWIGKRLLVSALSSEARAHLRRQKEDNRKQKTAQELAEAAEEQRAREIHNERVAKATRPLLKLLGDLSEDPVGAVVSTLPDAELKAAAQAKKGMHNKKAVTEDSKDTGEAAGKRSEASDTPKVTGARNERMRAYKQRKEVQADDTQSDQADAPETSESDSKVRASTLRSRNRRRTRRKRASRTVEIDTRQEEEGEFPGSEDTREEQVAGLHDIFRKYAAHQRILRSENREINRFDTRKVHRLRSVFSEVLSRITIPEERDQLIQDVYMQGVDCTEEGDQSAEFVSFVQGPIVEAIVGEEISGVVQDMAIPGVTITYRASTPEEDIHEGYDYVIEATDDERGTSRNLYVDAKSRGQFTEEMERRASIQYDDHLGEVIKNDKGIVLVNPMGAMHEVGRNSITRFVKVGERHIPSFVRDEDNLTDFQESLRSLIRERVAPTAQRSGQSS